MTWIRDSYAKTIYGVGFRGDGLYLISENGVHTHAYKTFHSMFLRCYDKKFHERQESYIDCFVNEEWHNFQNFAEWYKDNYLIDYQLDKDLILYGNKEYSEEKCIMVPRSINNLFKIHKSSINRKLPLGVKIGGNRYRSGIIGKSNSCSIKQAQSDYWNNKYDLAIKQTKLYPRFKNIILNYFEHFFNEHY